MNWSGDLLEEMSCPDDFTSFWWHVTNCWRILLGVLIEFLLDGLKIGCIDVEDVVVLVL